MSNIELPDSAGTVDTFTRTEGVDTVHMQAIVPVDPLSGDPLDLATEGTLAALSLAVGTLNTAAAAIKTAVEALNGKTSSVNTEAIGGTVALDAATLAALETISILGSVAITATGLPLPAGAATEATIALTARQKNSAASITDYGQIMLAQRRDADTPETTADGQYTALKQDEAGRLKVATQPASNAAGTGSITANAQNVSIPCGRFGNLSVSMAATSLVGHNASFECSNNSTNGTDGTWYGVQAVRSNANTVETTTGVLTATPTYMWHVNVGDYLYFRVRAAAHTSGTAAYILKPGSYATEPIPAVQITGTQPVSGTVTATSTQPFTPTASIVSSAATTNGTVVKAAAGTLYNVVASNTGAAVAYLKFHNSATVTVGTTAVALTIPIPAGGVVSIPFGALGMRFGTGICLSITNLGADADTTAVVLAQVKVITSFI